ncbi:glycoside hydrolase family 18 protein [Sphingosinicella sp. BN140058]|uniref:glycoside hydrolase family 18 protein n=1 Tax=Sphingosinicella sp. BN140058 TaxID=1892855 RepID=UPI001012540A|nr:glycosyl hydrolase family 18 protein [Sphingosinicella sp. BN140058]QAY78222.1 hypothetical protein ETR14_18060 [Sphingosinicella sp. BN140058]
MRGAAPKWLWAMLVGVGAAPLQAQPVVGTYYAATGNPEASAALPAEKLTHVIYAFATLCGSHPSDTKAAGAARAATCKGRRAHEMTVPRDRKTSAEIAALDALRRRNPKLKILASIGGWGMPLYPEMVRTPSSRARFVSSAVRFLRSHPQFDGIDIDWEYPGGGDNLRKLLPEVERAAEAPAFDALAQSLRTALDDLGHRSGRSYQLTAAIAGYPRSVRGVDWKTSQGAFNYLFVMTYDFTPEKSFAVRGDYSGGGGPPGHHTNLHASAATDGYGADAMIETLAGAGVPRAKMVIGAAFYAREWKDVDWDQGRFPAATPTGTFVDSVPYRVLTARDLSAKGVREGYDTAAEAAYAVSDGRLLSFDNPRSICAKGMWARRSGLAGIFAWEASQDDGSLVTAMHDSVNGGCKP